MAQTSVFGIRSGFDTADLLDKLVALAEEPINLKLDQRDLEVEKLDSFQELSSKLQTFKGVLTTLNTESRFLTNKGEFSKTTGDGEVVEVSPTSLATSGTFSLSVTQLAREGKVTSAGFASISTTIPEGIFEIKVGTKTTFIKIDSTNNTLDGLRLAINNSGADVQASFLDDGSTTNPIRLVISGTKTGAENAVSARLFSSGLGTGELDLINFTETQAAQDAIFNLDGIDITKSSNTVSDVIQGTTLTLTSTGSGTIKISTDRTAIKDKVKDFVDGYNDLVEFIQELLSFDPDTFETGTLFGNFTVQNLQETLRGVTTGEVPGLSGEFHFLSQIGITTQSTGFLSLDTSKLDEALIQDPANVSQLFSSRGTTSNSAVAFVGFTDKTVAGSYELRVLGGVPQLRKVGETTFVNATGSGNFFAGAEGTDAEGLNFRIATLVDGDYGTIDLTLGVAELLNREMTDLLDTTQKGPLQAEIDTLTNTIDDLDETIFDLDERLELFENNLRDRFTNLEIILGRLDTQKRAFDSSLASLTNLFSRNG